MTGTRTPSFSPDGTMASILPYAGGKSNVAAKLVNMFPQHHLYVDMFCGGLSVSLAKPPSRSGAEWFNDKYNQIANFFIVLKEMPEQFIEHFETGWVIDSEYHYRWYTERLKEPFEIPNVEHAVALWMTQKATFTGRNAARATSYRYKNKRLGGRHAANLPLERIQQMHLRLQGVQIFNRDFGDLFGMLSKYNDPTTFIYQDPPYYGVSGGGDYVEQFSKEDHKDLAEHNLATECRFLMTINDHEFIRSLYAGAEGIYMRHYGITYVANTRWGEGKQTQELLISNYDTEQQFGPLFG
jgi:DNA adenine methylase